MTRGGGASEELMGFNAEEVVRAVSASGVPVISAIGHEIDTTLSDWAADYRASTPTDAAKVLCAPVVMLKHRMLAFKERGIQMMWVKHERVVQSMQEVKETLHLLLSRTLEETERDFLQLSHRLKQCDPLLKLRQGFSILRSASDGLVLHSVSSVFEGDIVQIQLKDGVVNAVINGKEKVINQ